MRHTPTRIVARAMADFARWERTRAHLSWGTVRTPRHLPDGTFVGISEMLAEDKHRRAKARMEQFDELPPEGRWFVRNSPGSVILSWDRRTPQQQRQIRAQYQAWLGQSLLDQF